MAASTTLMQSNSSTPTATCTVNSSSVTVKQILSSSSGSSISNNGSVGHGSDSDSGTASDHDNSSHPHNNNNNNHAQHSNNGHEQQTKADETFTKHDLLDTSRRMTMDSSTEDEQADETNNTTQGGNMNASENNNSGSFQSWANLERNIKKNFQHSTPVRPKNARQSTGKLERITERLAKKQNGESCTDSKKCDSNVNSTIADQNNHLDDHLITNQNAQQQQPCKSAQPQKDQNVDMDEEDPIEDQLEINEDDDEDDEDDEEIKNGFRALGLMGNVAFMGDESFKCPVCQLKLDSQHTFTLHIRSHNPNDHSNTCSLCGKTLSSASSLDRHMLIHSGERPFKCSLCGMAFTTNGNMHRHMRTHGHGSIGYTPRGQKRRAKLLTQALEKAVAAAAAGEQVDFEAINKLKKSIMESKTTVPPPSCNTNSRRGQNRHKQPQQQSQPQSSSNSFSEQILSTLAPNVSIEAAAAAAVAAAHNATIKPPSSSNSFHPTNSTMLNAGNDDQKREKGPKDKAKSSVISCSSISSCSSLSNSSTSHCATSNNMPFGDGRTGLGTGLITNVPLMAMHSSVQPEKGRPGRKKKQRLSSLMNESNITSGATPDKLVLNHPIQSSSTSTPSNGTSVLGPLKTPSRCAICAHPVNNTTELHVHMMTYHMQERLFCNDCGMILDNYDTYTHHHCTATAASVMNALAQNPNLRSDLLFCSSNTSRMNFSSGRTYAASLEMLRGLPAAGQAAAAAAAANLFSAAQLTNLNHHPYANSNNNNNKSSKKNVLNQSLVDLGQSRPAKPDKPPTIHCDQCERKFGSNKQLKQHQETHCHRCKLDCDSVSTYRLHQFSHSFENLNAQPLNMDKMQLLKNAAFSLLPSMAHNPLISSALHSSSAKHACQAPVVQANHNVANGAPSSIASLSLMANMKPDLADIESILSMVHGTTAKDGKHSAAGNQLRSPISPNRASDAGELIGQHQHRQQVNGGEATNQPESPASADSAAAAVASSSAMSMSELLETGPNGATFKKLSNFNRTEPNQSQARTKTDLNHVKTETVLCLKTATSGDEDHNHSHQKTEAIQQSLPVLADKEEQQKQALDPDNVCKEPNNKIIKLKKENSPEQNIIAEAESEPKNGEKQKPNNTTSIHHSLSAGSRVSHRYRCDSCRLSFKSQNALRRHNRGHTTGGGHSHACHLCPYKSLDKSTLIRHLRTHNGERPFQCAICKYAFTTKANCERHVRKRHRNLKSKSEIRNAMQYNRDMAATAAATRLVSEKIFIEKDQLPTSQDTICKKCEMDFGSNRELRAHLRVANSPCCQQLKPFVCMICNIGFNTRNNCVRHIIKQHPSTIDVSEEDAAKAVEAESLMIETGSSSTFSPTSNEQASSNHSSFSGSISTTSSDHLSDCESYGTFDETNDTNETNGQLLANSGSSSSFAALCQVAQKPSVINGLAPSPLNLSSKKYSPPFSDTDDDANPSYLDKNGASQSETAILDLSFKTK